MRQPYEWAVVRGRGRSMRMETHFYRIIWGTGDLAHVVLSKREETHGQFRIHAEPIRYLGAFQRLPLTEHFRPGAERDKLVV